MSMKTLRFIIFMIGVFGLIWFLIPLFAHCILNIGNATGIVVFLCVILYSIKMSDINAWMIRIWGTVKGKIVLGVAGAVAAAIIVLVIIMSICMAKATHQKPDENATVIVLGCKVNGEQASRMLLERLEAAYEYLVENKDVVCILSGGKGNGESISEAECMYRYLVEKGIEPERLYKEDKSTSTRENLAFSKDIIEENNLNSQIAIVTNEFHEYRAGKIADALEMECGAVSAKTEWWLFPTYYVRELYGILYEWLKLNM